MHATLNFPIRVLIEIVDKSKFSLRFIVFHGINLAVSIGYLYMDTCSLDNINSVEEQASFPFKIIIPIGIMMIVAICILLKKHFKTYGHVHIMTSTEECAKVRGALVISSEFPSPPVQQKSTDKGELVY